MCVCARTRARGAAGAENVHSISGGAGTQERGLADEDEHARAPAHELRPAAKEVGEDLAELPHPADPPPFLLPSAILQKPE